MGKEIDNFPYEVFIIKYGNVLKKIALTSHSSSFVDVYFLENRQKLRRWKIPFKFSNNIPQAPFLEK